MQLYNLTLQKSTNITHAVHGNYSGQKQQEIAVARGTLVEILKDGSYFFMYPRNNRKILLKTRKIGIGKNGPKPQKNLAKRDNRSKTQVKMGRKKFVKTELIWAKNFGQKYRRIGSTSEIFDRNFSPNLTQFLRNFFFGFFFYEQWKFSASLENDPNSSLTQIREKSIQYVRAIHFR